MREIDFLPEWYKSSRRQQIGYQTQYIILGIVFVAMLLWSFAVTRSISKVEAGIAQIEPQKAKAQNDTQATGKIKDEVERLHKQAAILGEIDSRVNIADVLGEISFIADRRILLSKLQLTAEKFANKSAGGATGAENKNAMAFGEVRFKLVISGIAADAGDVAKLICRLEDSPYFQRVYPLFSKAKKVKVKADSSEHEYQLNEFEISCYLENYREE